MMYEVQSMGWVCDEEVKEVLWNEWLPCKEIGFEPRGYDYSKA
jgi:hypothetical protein